MFPSGTTYAWFSELNMFLFSHWKGIQVKEHRGDIYVYLQVRSLEGKKNLWALKYRKQSSHCWSSEVSCLCFLSLESGSEPPWPTGLKNAFLFKLWCLLTMRFLYVKSNVCLHHGMEHPLGINRYLALV